MLVLAVLSPIYVCWTWTNQIGSMSSDAPAYLVMAQHYSGEHRYPGAAAVAASQNRFPPLYPIALARLHAVDDLHRTHMVTTGFFLLALLALYGCLFRAGLLASEAALLTLLFAVLPGSWLLVLSLQSEFPYLLFSCISLMFLLMHWRLPRDEFLYAAALAAAAAMLTRSIGVTLLAPLLIGAVRAGRRPGMLALVLALAPLMLWHVFHHAAVGYTETLRLYYGDSTAPPLAAQLETTLSALHEGFNSSLGRTGGLDWLADALGVAFVAGLLCRGVKLQPDGVYLLVYLAAVLVWPFPDEPQRFLWPALPLLMAQPALALVQLAAPSLRDSWGKLAAGVVAAVVLIFALPALASASARFLSADDSSVPDARGMRSWYQADPAKAARRTAGEALAIGMLRRMAEEVPPGDCVISIRPDLVNYFAGRLAAWPPLDSVPEPRFSQQLHGAHCRYLFMTTASYTGYPVPLHPLQHLAGKIDVVDYGEVPLAAPGDGRIICLLAKFSGENLR